METPEDGFIVPVANVCATARTTPPMRMAPNEMTREMRRSEGCDESEGDASPFGPAVPHLAFHLSECVPQFFSTFSDTSFFARAAPPPPSRRASFALWRAMARPRGKGGSIHSGEERGQPNMARQDQHRVNGRFAKRKADADGTTAISVRVRLQGTEAEALTGSPAPVERQQPEGIAASFVCPILQGLPIVPVVAGDVRSQ